jgi:hypothetical protein
LTENRLSDYLRSLRGIAERRRTKGTESSILTP